MNFENNAIENKSPHLFTAEEALKDINMIAGEGAVVLLQDQSYEDGRGDIKGVLDANIDYGKPIYFDNGKQHTTNLVKLITKDFRTLIVTEDSVYYLEIPAEH